MPRKRQNFTLDSRIVAELHNAAMAAGFKSTNQFVEAGLFGLLQIAGRISADEKPLGEMRGGNRFQSSVEQDG